MPGVGRKEGGLWQRIARVLGRGDAVVLEEAERILIEADFGVEATLDLVEGLRRAPAAERQVYLERAVAGLLEEGGDAESRGGALARAAEPPTVILVYGVNGVGKTTTVAKLAHRLGREGRRVLLAAADTFRAGGASQLKIWAGRLGVPCVGAADGAAAIPPPWRSTLSTRRRPGIETRCWWTLRGGCTPNRGCSTS